MDSFTSSRRRLAFLDMLIEQHLKDPESLNEVDIREEVDTFMFEGYAYFKKMQMRLQIA